MVRLSATAAIALLLASSVAVAQEGPTGQVTLKDQSGTTLGTLELAESDGGVHVSGELTGVPNGEHGFHFHAVGTCDAAEKFVPAGPHFEPGDHKHGMDNPEGPHAGDLMNVTADADGKAVIDLHNANVTLSAGDASLADADGTALILHADADDYKTDPSGNSGDRIACGVVEVTQ